MSHFHHFYANSALSALVAFTPLQLDALSVWYDAPQASITGSAVNALNDLSNADNDATPPATANEATIAGATLNGKQGAQFNTGDNDDYYVMDAPILLDGEGSIFLLVQFGAAPSDEFILGLQSASGTSHSFGTFTDNKLRLIGEGEAFDSGALVSAQDVTSNIPYLIEIRKTTTGRELWINGVLDASDSLTSNFSFDVVGNYRAAAGGTSFEGILHSLMVFDGTVSSAERQKIYDYIGAQYFGAYDEGGFNPQAIVAADGSKDYLTPDLAATALIAGTPARKSYIRVQDGTYTTQLPTILKESTILSSQSNTGVTVQMLVDDNATPLQIQTNSPLDVFAVNAEVNGGIWIGENCRYVLHNEMGSAAVNLTQHYRNLTLIHLGNEGARAAQPGETIWAPAFAQAGGLCSGGLITHTNCNFKAAYGGVSMHNQNAIMADDAECSYTNCIISIEGDAPHFPLLPWAARCESILGTTAVTTVPYHDVLNLNDKGYLMITVSSAAPLYPNILQAPALAIETIPIVTGEANMLSYAGNAAAGLRFKQTALAVRYDNAQTTGELFVNLGSGSDARPLIWGDRTRYQLGYGNNSFTHGSLDVSGAYGANSLAARLGDLRTTPKTFAINSQNVTLDKDYRALSNADIIADINAQLTFVSVYEYSVMDAWRPRIDNMTADYTCGSSQSVAPGTFVTLPNGNLAVGWSYIAPNGTGKVLTHGKVSQYTATQAARDAIIANPLITDLTVELI